MEDDAVLRGPNLGVLRGVMRGVASVDTLPLCKGLSEVAAGGSAKSSRLESIAGIAFDGAELAMGREPLVVLCEFSIDINEAGVAGAIILPFISKLGGAE